MQTKPPTAALLVIGNEILSGKVQDVNTHYLASELFGLGWELREVAVVGDVQQQIVETLTATFEEMALHADIRTGDSFKSQAADAIAKAMKT